MIVALAAVDQERWSLASACCRNHWGVHFAETCEQASEAALQLKAPVILCDRDLLGFEWRSVMTSLASLAHGPRVILVSSVVDDCLWHAVERLGGHDALSKPLQEDQIVRAVTQAWSYWNSRPQSVLKK